jgi:hypothetical protein
VKVRLGPPPQHDRPLQSGVRVRRGRPCDVVCALSVPLVGKAGSRREWLVLIPVSGYAMVGMCTTAVGALDQNQWGPVQALLLGLAG